MTIMDRSISGLAQLCVFIAICFIAMLVACSPPFFDVGQSHNSGYGYLALKFETNRSWVEVGASIQMRFTVKNTGNQLVAIESRDKPVLDIIVQDVNSRELLLSWSAQNPESVAHRIEWKPGESRVLELSWTATQDEYYGTLHMGGILTEDSKIVQSANVPIYVGRSGPP
jgi:hypothetical protein